MQDNAAWLRFQAECEKRYTILASTELAQVQSKAVAAVGGYSSGSPDLGEAHSNLDDKPEGVSLTGCPGSTPSLLQPDLPG